MYEDLDCVDIKFARHVAIETSSQAGDCSFSVYRCRVFVLFGDYAIQYRQCSIRFCFEVKGDVRMLLV